MNRSQTYIRFLLTVLPAVAACIFFGICYPHHLHWQEQMQLFQFTSDYFFSVARIPGGLADWLGRLLTQFFYFSWAGAVIIAVVLLLLQCTVRVVAGYRDILVASLSCIPVLCVFSFLCDENALLGAPIALLLSLTAVLVVRKFHNEAFRHITVLVLIPVLYFLLGGIAIIFTLFAILDMRHKYPRGKQHTVFIIVAILLTVFCPLVAKWFIPYPTENLILGIHYYRFRSIMPWWIWAAALSIVLVAGIGPLEERLSPKGALATSLIVFFALSVGALPAVKACSDFAKEEAMKYDYMVRMHTWNRLMMTADRKMPNNPMTVSCLNLALSASGRMADHLFEYYQNGPEGLLPSFVRDFTSPLPTAEAYYLLGMINTAQRFTFEAEEAIPDFQKSARCHKRLAETNLINGDYAVARTFLLPLTHTVYYRRWALEVLSLLGDEERINAHPEYGRLRQLRLHKHDFLFSDTEMDSMLGLLYVENNTNMPAFEYLLTWNLLRKDLDRFTQCLELRSYTVLPRVWQEALLLRWALQHDTLAGRPPYLTDAYATRLDAFITAQQSSKPVSYMQKHFGDTYWFYYFYRYQ